MANYTKLTNFATKDSLASGNPLKVIKGTEIDDEFENVETAIATKANTASPTFTGTVTIPTANITTANVTTADFGAWEITQTSGNLVFSYGGVAKFTLASTGDVTVASGDLKVDGEVIATDDITAFGTI
jgi:hypothetical protein